MFRKGHFLPYRWTYNGGLLNTVFSIRFRRKRLLREAAEAKASSKADITAIVPHRNRVDWRLINAITALKYQSFSSGTVRVLVVDYGSTPENREKLQALAISMDFDCLLVNDVEGWNRSHCINIGLRHVATTYTMVSDADVIPSPAYLQSAVDALIDKPLRFGVAPRLLLPEELTEQLVQTAESGAVVDADTLRPFGVIKTAFGYSTGVIVVLTRFVKQLNGFDEWYRDYGAEDVDMVNRLEWLGLKPAILSGNAFYLHQWHARHAGVAGPGLQERIDKNNVYLNKMKTLRRNRDGWGEGNVIAYPAPRT